MKTSTLFLLGISLVAGLLLSTTNATYAETIYTAVIDGPSANTPSPATGTAVLTLNDDQTEVAYVIVYSGLIGVDMMAHFHTTIRGMDGPILETLAVGSPKVGIWPVDAYEIGELNAGRVYLNIHTDVYAVGEIRGNVMPTTVSTESASWGEIKGLFR